VDNGTVLVLVANVLQLLIQLRDIILVIGLTHAHLKLIVVLLLILKVMHNVYVNQILWDNLIVKDI